MGPEGEIEYDDLVLATGSSPFVPPVSGLRLAVPGIFLYRPQLFSSCPDIDTDTD